MSNIETLMGKSGNNNADLSISKTVSSIKDVADELGTIMMKNNNNNDLSTKNNTSSTLLDSPVIISASMSSDETGHSKKDKEDKSSKVSDIYKTYIHKQEPETFSKITSTNVIEINRLNKYLDIDFLYKALMEFPLIVKFITTAILNGDSTKDFCLIRKTKENFVMKDDDKFESRLQKIMNRINKSYNLNETYSDLLSNTVKYGDGFLLASPISERIIETIDRIKEKDTNFDADNFIDDNSIFDTFRECLNEVNEETNDVLNENYIQPTCIATEDSIYYGNIKITKGELDNLSSFYEKTMLTEVKMMSNGMRKNKVMKHLKLSSYDNLDVLVEQFKESGILEYVGGIDEFCVDENYHIFESTSLLINNIEDIINEDAVKSGGMYSYNQMFKSKISLNNDRITNVKNILDIFRKKSLTMKGSIVKNINPYNIIKISNQDNLCLGYIYINSEEELNTYDRTGKGTVGASANVSSRNFNPTVASSATKDLYAKLRTSDEDNDDLNNISKTLMKILISNIKLPDAVGKMADKDFLDFFRMIDPNKKNKLYYFKPDDITHLTYGKEDGKSEERYGKGALDDLIQTGKLLFVLNRLELMKSLPAEKNIKVVVPTGENVEEILGSVRENLLKMKSIDHNKVGNYRDADSMIMRTCTNLIPKSPDSDMEFIEIEDKANPFESDSSEYRDKVENNLRKMNIVPNKIFDNEDGDVKVVSILHESTWVNREMTAKQFRFNDKLSALYKNIISNEVMTYSEIIHFHDIDKKNLKSKSDKTIKDIKDNKTLASVITSNDLANLSKISNEDNLMTLAKKFHPGTKSKETIDNDVKDDEKEIKKKTKELTNMEFDKIKNNSMDFNEIVEFISLLNLKYDFYLPPITQQKWQELSELKSSIEEGIQAEVDTILPEELVGKASLKIDGLEDNLDAIEVLRGILKSEKLKAALGMTSTQDDLDAAKAIFKKQMTILQSLNTKEDEDEDE